MLEVNQFYCPFQSNGVNNSHKRENFRLGRHVLCTRKYPLASFFCVSPKFPYFLTGTLSPLLIFFPLIPASFSLNFFPSVPSCVMVSSSTKDRVGPVSHTASVLGLLTPVENDTATTLSKLLQALAAKTCLLDDSPV